MTTYALFYPTAPANTAADPSSVSLGTFFKLSITGWVTGVNFWKTTDDAGPWDVYLYDGGSGSVLAYKSVPSAVDGWNSVLFDSAVATIVSDVSYMAAFHSSTGNYGFTSAAFATDVTNGPITATSNGSNGDGNGAFRYQAGGSGALIPNSSFGHAWYGVEPIFSDTAPDIHGSLDVTEDGDTLSAGAGVLVSAALDVNEADDSIEAAATVGIEANEGVNEQPDTLIAVAAVGIAAVLSQTEQDDVLVASLITVAGEPIEADLEVTEADDALVSRFTIRSARPTLSEIIPSILNDLVASRVWQQATPDNLPRGAGGVIQPFVLWHRVGGQDQEYLDQTMPSHRHARIQVQCCAPGAIDADTLQEAVCQAMVGSAYTVGVLGSPVGTYDASRKLHAPWRQFSIWFQP